MLTLVQLEQLLSQSESTTLDYKRTLYDFSGDSEKANANLIKDVCAMINTIRTGPSFIIFGVDASPNQNLQITGLDKVLDDSIIQEKVMSKTDPRPEFVYYNMNYHGKQIGIMEFPIRHYELPVVPTIKMKGLTVGQVYYRAGTSNTEASGREAIRISDWLRSLPKVSAGPDKKRELHDLLTHLQDSHEALSKIISIIYKVAKEFHLRKIVDFCELELNGPQGGSLHAENADTTYRIVKVFIDAGGVIELNQRFSVAHIKEALQQNDHIIKSEIHIGQTLRQLEEMLNYVHSGNNNRVAVLKSTSRQLFPQSNIRDINVNVYLFPDDLEFLIKSIRDHAIKLLMEELQ